jgi:exonuclease VII small subunit
MNNITKKTAIEKVQNLNNKVFRLEDEINKLQKIIWLMDKLSLSLEEIENRLIDDPEFLEEFIYTGR